MESPPSPAALVREIYEQHGLSEPQIAAELAELGVRISQPTLNRIRRDLDGETPRKGELALLTALLRLREKLNHAAAPIGASEHGAARP